MKHFKIIEASTITHGKITLASLCIASKKTGEVFEATAIAKCSPEDKFNRTVGIAIASKRAYEKVGCKAYKATLKLAEKMRLDAEKMADHAIDEANEIGEVMETFQNLADEIEKRNVKEEPIE